MDVSPLESVYDGNEDRRQDRREDQRDQKVADQPSEGQGDGAGQRDTDEPPCGGSEELQPSEDAGVMRPGNVSRPV